MLGGRGDMVDVKYFVGKQIGLNGGGSFGSERRSEKYFISSQLFLVDRCTCT